MGKSAPEQVRNVAFVSHFGAKKGDVIEAMLFEAKAIKARGSVDKGDVTVFTEPEEVSRKMPIGPHMVHFSQDGVTFNIIDNPEYSNFLESARSVFPGVDGGVIVFSGIDGIRPEGCRLWEMLVEARVPALGFMTQLEDAQANLKGALAKIENELGLKALPVTLPIGEGAGLQGIIDLIERKAWIYKGSSATAGEIPEEMKAEVEGYRTQLIEKLAEADDKMIEEFLEGKELSNDELHLALKISAKNRSFIPIYCGSGSKGIGVRNLVDAMVQHLPSPIEREADRPFVGHKQKDAAAEVKRSCKKGEPFSALVLRTTIDPFSGKLSIIRVISGEIKDGDALLNVSHDMKQKVAHAYYLQGKELVAAGSLSAGDIGAISKLEETKTCDTLSDLKDVVIFTPVQFLAPQVAYAVEAEKKTEEKVSGGLSKLTDEDPSLRVYRHDSTHELILAGMGQAHLEVALEKLERKFGGKATLRVPSVPYRETIHKKVEMEGKLKKQTGGHGQFAKCVILAEPRPRNAGFEYVDMIKGGAIPRQFIPSVEKGVIDAMTKGVLGAFPVVDVRVSVIDGQYHDVDSSDYAFQVAGSMAFKAAMQQADPVLLEPIMSVNVTIPDDCTGDVMKDLSGRRGKVLGMEASGKRQVIKAEVPMSEMLEYGNILSAITSGRGFFTMAVTTYSEVPSHLAQKVLEGRKVEEAQE